MFKPEVLSLTDKNRGTSVGSFSFSDHSLQVLLETAKVESVRPVSTEIQSKQSVTDLWGNQISLTDWRNTYVLRVQSSRDRENLI